MRDEIEINEVEAQSILSDSGIYSVDYALNPYTGCAHGCNYCYATFMRKYTDHASPWGSFVDVKINAPQLLEKELLRKKPGSVLLSSVTDPYQPVEEKYQLTRKVLKRLAPSKFTATILTKSDLVTRDQDLLQQFKAEQIDVGFTINFTSEEDRQLWEPGASSIDKMFEAIRKLAKNDIPIYVHVGPYFPGITNLETILDRVGSHIRELQIENINTRGKQTKLRKIVDKEYPRLDAEQVVNSAYGKRELLGLVDRLRRNYDVDINLFLD